jgi:hypothetical protein
MKLIKTSLLFVIMSLTLVSCEESWFSDSYSGWFNKFGKECGNLAPGCDYWAATGDLHDKIHADEDPYFDSHHPGDFESYATYYYQGLPFHDVWVSRSGIIYDAWTGEALNRDGDFVSGRDVITDVAVAQEKSLQAAASYYARKFSLSAAQGVKIARTINDFSTMANRTEQDVADFTRRLYGIDINVLKPALSSAALGNTHDLTLIINDAAISFGTSPENMRNVIKSLHSELLNDAGINLD